ncbi:hypothetical protein [Flavobacterium sp.]|uniref:hypothetical protein n=1 Tax=Flavobacterium sp. TaxID=239 RepID=UPI0035B16D8F
MNHIHTAVDKYSRPNRKYYSADGSMEIKVNIPNNKIEFITYIGGDGYSAPIIYKLNYDNATPSGAGGCSIYIEIIRVVF